MTARNRGALGTGRRGMARKKAAFLKQVKDRQWAQEKLDPHLDDFIDALVADMRDRECVGHRTAMSVIPDLMEWGGMGVEAAERLLEAVGLQQETLALAAGMFHSAAGATVDDAERAAVATIQTLVKAHPDRRARLMEACFGMRDAAAPRELEGRNGTS